LKRLRSIYGSVDALDFDPLKYQAFRRMYIDDGLARTTINKYCWHVRKMFQHAGRNELVPMSFYRDLDAVGNLLEGRSDARETDDVMPVDAEILDATIKQLHPILADMVRLQLLSGMRPGEVRTLRPCDIDREPVAWKYIPPTHKNQHKKSRKAKTRVVRFGLQAQELFNPTKSRSQHAGQ
jgi:integrase